jgi:alkaline phosphatase
MKRRDLIRGGLLAGAAGVAGLGPAGAALAHASGRGTASAAWPDRGAAGRARNIIFYAYDGMTWEDVGVAQFYARRHRGGPLTLQRLLGGGRSGSMETYSLTSVVTDSSAAASAWTTGRKIVNGMINVYPDGTRLVPMLEIARAQGRATGLVTTTRITHATPAAWVAQVENRDQEDEIAAQYLAFRPDVLLGGGARHFIASRRRDGRDLPAEFTQAGYGVVRTAEQLAGSNASRLLGLFADDHLPFEIDRVRQHAGGPSLAQMTRKALALLDGHERGFVALVEAGRIDHANHKNDAAATVHDMMAADDTLELLLQWVDMHPDTLLILASDHGTGGGAAHGVGSRYRNSSVALERIDGNNASFDHILPLLRLAGGRAAMGEVMRAHTGVELDDRQLDMLEGALELPRSGVNRLAYQDQPYNTMGFVVHGGGGTLHSDRVNVNFSTGQHTAGPVPVAVYGHGAGALQPTFVDNTALFGWMTAALGSDHVNPVMTEAAALDALEQALNPSLSGEPAAHSVAAAGTAVDEPLMGGLHS